MKTKFTWTIYFAFGPDFHNLSLLNTPDTLPQGREIVQDEGDPRPFSLRPP